MAQLNKQFHTAVITGASSGLGLAFCKMLLAEGVRVIGVSRKPNILPEATGYVPVECDLSDPNAMRNLSDTLFSDYPEINLLINNAGFGVLESLAELSADAVRQQLMTMLEAPIHLTAASIRHFRKQSLKGCVVNVSSLAVELPLPLMPIYNVSKAGLSALSESLVLDTSPEEGIRFIDFRPGDFNTNFAQSMEGEVEWNGVNLRAVMDAHHARAPSVEIAVASLRKALLRERSAIIRSGDFFQSKIAPWGTRLLPRSMLLWLIRAYYRK